MSIEAAPGGGAPFRPARNVAMARAKALSSEAANWSRNSSQLRSGSTDRICLSRSEPGRARQTDLVYGNGGGVWLGTSRGSGQGATPARTREWAPVASHLERAVALQPPEERLRCPPRSTSHA